MTSRSSTRRRIVVLVMLVAGLPLVVACTVRTPGNNTPQGPEPTQGPFASAGTETVPAMP
jgi:hypothetical protein